MLPAMSLSLHYLISSDISSKNKIRQSSHQSPINSKLSDTLPKSRDINRGGMGLGLTISKMILQQLKGDITVKSEPKKGSIFTFRIPIAELKNMTSSCF